MPVQQFLERRFAALNQGDYEAVYASYHCDAPFLEQFGDRSTYLRFAKQQLTEIKVENWKCLCQRQVAAQQIEVILTMEIATPAGSQNFFELALLIKTTDGWRYHSAQKLGPDDYSGSPDQLDFSHFDDAAQKIRF